MKFVKFFSAALALSMLAGSAFAGYVSTSINMRPRYLPDCGGTVEVNNGGRGDQVNVVFSNVENCSKFDIRETNDGRVAYEEKSLQGRNGNKSGSFSLPRRFIDRGYNSVVVQVSSNSGKHKDYVEVTFRNRGNDRNRRHVENENRGSY